LYKITQFFGTDPTLTMMKISTLREVTWPRITSQVN